MTFARSKYARAQRAAVCLCTLALAAGTVAAPGAAAFADSGFGLIDMDDISGDYAKYVETARNASGEGADAASSSAAAADAGNSLTNPASRDMSAGYSAIEKTEQETAAAAAAALEAQTTSGTYVGNLVDTSAYETALSVVDWSVPKETFISEWGRRIDTFLVGSPLYGYGRTFAQAAYEYGVDPRWSPAISNTESSKGAICFRSHNAWGWGQVDWPDWETAIYAHIKGLAEGYGYTLSRAAAEKYCESPDLWYANTLAAMLTI